MAKSRSVGTKFYVDDKLVGSLTSINAPELTADTTDVTALDNKDGYKEFLGGFKDGGEVALEGFMDGEDAGQAAMYDAFEDQARHTCKVVFPEAIGKTWTFQGVVSKFKSGDASLGDALKFSTSVKVSGKPTLDASPAEAAAQPEAQNEAQNEAQAQEG